MSTTVLDQPAVQPTDHPHIVRVAGVCGGSPIIKGSRIAVRQIAHLYKAGETVEEMVQAYPHLSPASVYDAISYYLDHQTEIEQELSDNRLSALVEKHGLRVDERGFVQFDESQSG